MQTQTVHPRRRRSAHGGQNGQNQARIQVDPGDVNTLETVCTAGRQALGVQPALKKKRIAQKPAPPERAPQRTTVQTGAERFNSHTTYHFY